MFKRRVDLDNILTKKYLLQKYVVERLGYETIAKLVGCNGCTVRDRLVEHNILIRKQGAKPNGLPKRINNLSEEVLRLEYIVNKKSILELSKTLNCDQSTISSRLQEYEIPLRTRKEANSLQQRIIRLEALFTKEFLIENYIEEKLSLKKIEELTGASGDTIKRYLKQFNIPIRTKSEAFKNEHRVGPLASGWRGGITPLYTLIRALEESDLWRFAIYERAHNICERCHKKAPNGHAHHIRPFAVLLREFLQYYLQFSPIEDKETLAQLAITWAPFWDISNGELLCKDCHDAEKQRTYDCIKEQRVNSKFKVVAK